MDNIGNNKLSNVLKLWEPELDDFQNLVKDMSLVDSPYKNEFNDIRSLVKKKPNQDSKEKIHLLIDELNHFRIIFEKIVEDDDVRELYIKQGLLYKSVALQTRILSKLKTRHRL